MASSPIKSIVITVIAGAGLLVWPVEPAFSQSIVTDGDIVGDGISLQALRDSHCEHLRSQHAGSGLPLLCTLPPGTRFVFVTSNGSSAGGNLVAWADSLLSPQTFTDGLLAADAICQYHAENATTPLPGTYKAWLSTDTVDAKDRIGDHKWVLPDATTVIADSLADLLDCTTSCLQNPINRNEHNQTAPRYTITGTGSDGKNVTGRNCQNWTDYAVEPNLFYEYGESLVTHDGWTQVSGATCNVIFVDSLYCFGN